MPGDGERAARQSIEIKTRAYGPNHRSVAATVVVGSVGGAVDAGAVVLATGPVNNNAGAGSSSSSPGSAGIPIQRISPSSQRWTNGK